MRKWYKMGTKLTDTYRIKPDFYLVENLCGNTTLQMTILGFLPHPQKIRYLFHLKRSEKYHTK